MSKIDWFQLHNCDYFQVFFVFSHFKLNTIGMVQTKQSIWRHHNQTWALWTSDGHFVLFFGIVQTKQYSTKLIDGESYTFVAVMKVRDLSLNHSLTQRRRHPNGNITSTKCWDPPWLLLNWYSYKSKGSAFQSAHPHLCLGFFQWRWKGNIRFQARGN